MAHITDEQLDAIMQHPAFVDQAASTIRAHAMAVIEVIAPHMLLSKDEKLSIFKSLAQYGDLSKHYMYSYHRAAIQLCMHGQYYDQVLLETQRDAIIQRAKLVVATAEEAAKAKIEAPHETL